MQRFTKSTLNHWFDNLQRENYLNEQDEDIDDDMNFTINPNKVPEGKLHVNFITSIFCHNQCTNFNIKNPG